MSASRIRRALALALLAAPLSAFAFPDKPIEWVVPYPAGGGTDVVAHTRAEQMSQSLNATIVVNNKPGAATTIGADYVAKAKADGHVVLSADTATLAANPSLYAKLTYSAERDFAPAGLMARFPTILVVHARCRRRTSTSSWPGPRASRRARTPRRQAPAARTT